MPLKKETKNSHKNPYVDEDYALDQSWKSSNDTAFISSSHNNSQIATTEPSSD